MILTRPEKDRLAAEFVGAVAALHIDSEGVWNLPVELEHTAKLALRIKQEMFDEESPAERALFGLANTIQLLVSHTGVYNQWLDPGYPELVAKFFAQRAELANTIPATAHAITDDEPVQPSPDAVRHGQRSIEPRYTEAPAADPLANSETVEGGYRWFDDGRAPEPV